MGSSKATCAQQTYEPKQARRCSERGFTVASPSSIFATVLTRWGGRRSLCSNLMHWDTDAAQSERHSQQYVKPCTDNNMVDVGCTYRNQVIVTRHCHCQTRLQPFVTHFPLFNTSYSSNWCSGFHDTTSLWHQKQTTEGGHNLHMYSCWHLKTCRAPSLTGLHTTT